MAFASSDHYSDHDIERAMATVARVIELYGDAYWPILERLESELDQRRAKSARLNKHLKRYHNRRTHSPKSTKTPSAFPAKRQRFL